MNYTFFECIYLKTPVGVSYLVLRLVEENEVRQEGQTQSREVQTTTLIFADSPTLRGRSSWELLIEFHFWSLPINWRSAGQLSRAA